MALPGSEEPRFAGSVPAGYQPPVHPPTAAAFPTSPAPTSPPADLSPFPPALQPQVSYADALEPPEPAPRALPRPHWLGPVVAGLGGIVAIVGSGLDWATLRLVSKTLAATPDPQDSERITYSGLSLLEGRVALLVGVVAVVLSVLMLLRRPLPTALAVAGATGVLVALFASIAHPVDLSGLSRVFGAADDVSVRIPNGPGVWLALVGSALILAGGLLAQLWRDPPDAPAAREQPDATSAHETVE